MPRPFPPTKDQVHHFLLVSVSGTSVTVTPTNALGRTFDPVTYNAPAQNANLSLTKTDSPDPVLAGQQLTYNLTVGNAGPRAATGSSAHRHAAERRDVRVRDSVAGHVLADRAAPSRARWARSANGANATVQIKVRPQATGSITNTATVASNVNDPSTGNNSASAATTVNPAADLAITKTDSPDPVPAGAELTYTVGVSNAGPSTATGVSVTDTLPAGVDLRLGHALAGQLLAGIRHGHLLARDMPANGAIRERLDQGHAPVRRHDHELGQRHLAHRRPQHGQQRRQRRRPPSNPAADLSLTKTDAPDPVLVGQLLTYTSRSATPDPPPPPA